MRWYGNKVETLEDSPCAPGLVCGIERSSTIRHLPKKRKKDNTGEQQHDDELHFNFDTSDRTSKREAQIL